MSPFPPASHAPRPPPGAAARPPVSRPDLFVHLRERLGAQLGSSWATSRHRGRGVGPSFDSRDCARMRVPSAEGGPEARIQTPETERCQTPDHQTTSPPGIRTHQVSLECMCLLAHPLTPSPPRSPSRPKARRRRRSSSYARSASPASRMRCTTCSRGRPKRRCCVCVRATAASRRCRGVPAGVAG